MNTKISFNQEDQISVFVSEEWATGSVKFDSGYVDLEVGLIAATIRAHCKEISAHLQLKKNTLRGKLIYII